MRWKLAPLLVVLFLFLPGASAAADNRLNVSAGDSPTRGAIDAPVTVIEFIDFQ